MHNASKIEELEAAVKTAVAALVDEVGEARSEAIAASSFALAVIYHPAFDAVRIDQLRNRSERFKAKFEKQQRAADCLRFLQWIASVYESTDTMHPLARLFKHNVSPSTDSKGNACVYAGETVIDAIEHWMSETSYALTLTKGIHTK